MKSIQRHRIFLFFVLTIALTWAVWIPAAVARLYGTDSPLAPSSPLGGLARWTPGLVAILLAAVMAGKAGVKALFRPLRFGRVNIFWYAFALCFEVGLFFAAKGMDTLLGHSFTVVSPLAQVYGAQALADAASGDPVRSAWSAGRRVGLARLRLAGFTGPLWGPLLQPPHWLGLGRLAHPLPGLLWHDATGDRLGGHRYGPAGIFIHVAVHPHRRQPADGCPVPSRSTALAQPAWLLARHHRRDLDVDHRPPVGFGEKWHQIILAACRVGLDHPGVHNFPDLALIRKDGL